MFHVLNNDSLDHKYYGNLSHTPLVVLPQPDKSLMKKFVTHDMYKTVKSVLNLNLPWSCFRGPRWATLCNGLSLVSIL